MRESSRLALTAKWLPAAAEYPPGTIEAHDPETNFVYLIVPTGVKA